MTTTQPRRDQAGPTGGGAPGAGSTGAGPAGAGAGRGYDPNRNDFRRKLGYYLTGLAIGLMLLGLFHLAKRQAIRAQAANQAPGAAQPPVQPPAQAPAQQP